MGIHNNYLWCSVEHCASTHVHDGFYSESSGRIKIRDLDNTFLTTHTTGYAMTCTQLAKQNISL